MHLTFFLVRFVQLLPRRRYYQTTICLFVVDSFAMHVLAIIALSWKSYKIFGMLLAFFRHAREWHLHRYESNVLRYSENWWCENQGEEKDASFPHPFQSLNYTTQYCIRWWTHLLRNRKNFCIVVMALNIYDTRWNLNVHSFCRDCIVASHTNYHRL